MIDVERIDRHLKAVTAEATKLRKMTSEKWAQSKADQMEDLKELLNEVRRDQRMRGPDGKRIDR